MHDSSFLTIFDEILSVIAGNKRIWIPVLGAWTMGFFHSLWLKEQTLRRKSDKQLRVYMTNAVVAFGLYCLFNLKMGYTIYLPQATLAAAVATLLPAVWFWWQQRKQ